MQHCSSNGIPVQSNYLLYGEFFVVFFSRPILMTHSLCLFCLIPEQTAPHAHTRPPIFKQERVRRKFQFLTSPPHPAHALIDHFQFPLSGCFFPFLFIFSCLFFIFFAFSPFFSFFLTMQESQIPLSDRSLIHGCF